MQDETYHPEGGEQKLSVVRGGAGVPLARLALEFGEEEAQLAAREGQLAYLGRLLVQLTLPHSQLSTNEYTRTNRLVTLTMMAPSHTGLPYGSIPRLLLAWLSTRAVQTRSREIYLGRSMNEFMEQLGLARSGGKRGDITRLKDQVSRLFSTMILARGEAERFSKKGERLVGEQLESFKVGTYFLAWHPWNPDQMSIEDSVITLSEEFYEQTIAHPVPLDKAILAAVRRSPMALDIYAWLTWRLPLVGKPTTVSWEDLQRQFGAHYGRTRSFRQFFLRALRLVLDQYPDARVEPTPVGLLLSPSRSSVPRLR